MQHSYPLLDKVLNDIDYYQKNSIKQTGRPTYAHKILKKEGKLDFNLTVEEIDRHIRAFKLWPGAYFYLGDDSIKVGKYYIKKNHSNCSAGTIIAINTKGISIQVANGVVTFTHLQFPSKKMLPVRDILNGKDLYCYIRNSLI